MQKYTLVGIVLSLGVIATLAFSPAKISASDSIDYSPGLIEEQLADGKTVLAYYASGWCITCIIQERHMNKLRSVNPTYDQQLTFIRVDWNDYSEARVTTDRNVPRRSTLLLLRGDEELGRMVAGTSQDAIKALFDLGL